MTDITSILFDPGHANTQTSSFGRDIRSSFESMLYEHKFHLRKTTPSLDYVLLGAILSSVNTEILKPVDRMVLIKENECIKLAVKYANENGPLKTSNFLFQLKPGLENRLKFYKEDLVKISNHFGVSLNDISEKFSYHKISYVRPPEGKLYSVETPDGQRSQLGESNSPFSVVYGRNVHVESSAKPEDEKSIDALFFSEPTQEFDKTVSNLKSVEPEIVKQSADEAFKHLTRQFHVYSPPERLNIPINKVGLMEFFLGAFAFNFKSKFGLKPQLNLDKQGDVIDFFLMPNDPEHWLSEKIPIRARVVSDRKWDEYYKDKLNAYPDTLFKLPSGVSTEAEKGIIVSIKESGLSGEGSSSAHESIITSSHNFDNDKTLIEHVLELPEGTLDNTKRSLRTEIEKVRENIMSKNGHHFLSSYILGQLSSTSTYKENEIEKWQFFYHDAYTPDDLYAFIFKVKGEETGYLINTAENPHELNDYYGQNLMITEIPSPPVEHCGIKQLYRIDIAMHQEPGTDSHQNTNPITVETVNVRKEEVIPENPNAPDGRFFELKGVKIDELIEGLHNRPEGYKEFNELTNLNEIFDDSGYGYQLEIPEDENEGEESMAENYFENHILNYIQRFQKNIRTVTDLEAFIKGLLYKQIKFTNHYNGPEPVIAIHPENEETTFLLSLNHVSKPTIDEQINELNSQQSSLIEKYTEDYKAYENKRKASLLALTYNTAFEPDFDTIDNIMSIRIDSDGANSETFESCLGTRRRKRAIRSCAFDLKKKIEQKMPKQSIVDQKYNALEKKYNEITLHFSKVRRYSNFLMQGQMLKDVISGILKGDAEQVVISGSFIMGSIALGKLSNIMATSGLKLMQTESRLLGKLMLSTAPFLSRGTSAFVIFDLVKQIQRYKNNDTDALVSITGDSLCLAIDAIDIGIEVAEAFGLIEGISATTGPIGIAITTAIFIGVDIYQAVKAVEKVNSIIKLSPWEKFKEGGLEFIHYGLSYNTQHLLEEKQYIDYLMDKQSKNLRSMNDIKDFVFPMIMKYEYQCQINKYWTALCLVSFFSTCYRYERECKSKIIEIPNSEVDLSVKTTENSRIWPANIQGFDVLCSKIEGGYAATPKNVSLCINTMGITDLSKKPTDKVLIRLGEGIDRAVGAKDRSNIFVLGNGVKYVTGGDLDDIFVLTGIYTAGKINGLGGVNTLNLQSFATSYDTRLRIYWENTTGNVQRVVRVSKVNQFIISNIHNIIGRKGKPELVICSCEMKYVSLQGGKSLNKTDRISVPSNLTCQNPIQFDIEGYTDVPNRGIAGTFIYNIMKSSGKVRIWLLHKEHVKHIINFEYSINDIFKLRIFPSKHQPGTFNCDIKFNDLNSDKKYLIRVLYSTNNVQYRFADGAVLRIEKNKAILIKNISTNIGSAISEHTPIANRLNCLIILFAKYSGATILIGHGSPASTHPSNKTLINANLLPNNPGKETHLVGGHAENIFHISLNENISSSLSDLKKIEPVYIYHFEGSQHKNILDLSQIYEILHKNNIDLSLQTYKINKDVLIAMNAKQKGHTKLIGYITLKDGMSQEHYKFLLVNIKKPMKIELQQSRLVLIPVPIIIHPKVKVVSIEADDVAEGTKLVIHKPKGYLRFIRLQDTLMITNSFDQFLNSSEWLSIVLKDFYKQSGKILQTLKIQYKDDSISFNTRDPYYYSVQNALSFKKTLHNFKKGLFAAYLHKNHTNTQSVSRKVLRRFKVKPGSGN